MSKYRPLDFQRKAIDSLLEQFLLLWREDNHQSRLVLHSPTGSGKTFMLSCFIKELNTLPHWDFDKAFIWITFSDTLVMQSKEKIKKYCDYNLENNLITVEDFKQGKLNKNDILFINWQKLVSNTADNRILRRPSNKNLYKEKGYYFEDLIENTLKENREIILIIDESHMHVSKLAQENVINFINPRVILYASATPKEIPRADELEDIKAGYVRVKHCDVVQEGLIKEKIVVQTEEELNSLIKKDLDELLIELAINKKLEVENEYKKLKKDVNPLILIQLPNDDKKLNDLGQKTKEEIVLDYLINKNIDIKNKVALWFDNKQINMEGITNNNSDIDFLLFKQAAGTGWDCPRAHILIMYREINSPTFHTQIVGRILRTYDPSEKDLFQTNYILNTGFLYTNYKRNEIGIPNESANNKPFLYIAKRKKYLRNVDNLYSDYVSRIDYGDLGNSCIFQKHFCNSLNKYFEINNDDSIELNRSKLQNKGIDMNPKISNAIIVNTEFFDYDSLNLNSIQTKNIKDYELSRNDIEKLFNYLCYKVLLEQTDKESKISNVSRSWSPFKSALRIWFKRVTAFDSTIYYKIFIADINKNQSSLFRPAITYALKEYFPIKKKFIEQKAKEIEEKERALFIINKEYSFTEDYAELDKSEGTSRLSAIQPFFLRKKYNGRINELKFISYLEQKTSMLDWWFKNGENSKEFYCLKYFNSRKKEFSLFYPDWIIKFKDGKIGLFDTKSGFTAENTEGRAKGLKIKILELNKEGTNCVGGITVLENNQWYYFNNINSEVTYEYIPGKLTQNWELLDKLFN